MSILKRKKLDKRSAEIENYALPVRFGPEMRVLIIGGGIAGLTLAGLLQQRGLSRASSSGSRSMARSATS